MPSNNLRYPEISVCKICQNMFLDYGRRKRQSRGMEIGIIALKLNETKAELKASASRGCQSCQIRWQQLSGAEQEEILYLTLVRAYFIDVESHLCLQLSYKVGDEDTFLSKRLYFPSQGLPEET